MFPYFLPCLILSLFALFVTIVSFKLLETLHSHKLDSISAADVYKTLESVPQASEGMWDEIVEMLKRYELPDGFECRKEWIELVMKFRRSLESLDISNYYRHLKNDDIGPYMRKAKPKRYRFTQKWLEYAERMPPDGSSESWFWAEVEEAKAETSIKPFEQVKEKVLGLERQTCEWFERGLLDKYVFFEESTFIKWWKRLPQQHRDQSRILAIIKKLNST